MFQVSRPQAKPIQLPTNQQDYLSQEQDSTPLGMSLTPTVFNFGNGISPTPSINDSPPELQSTEGEIVDVKVYSNKAEITRRFRYTVKKGENQLIISGLPKVLDRESVRAYRLDLCDNTITTHGVTTSRITPPKHNNKSDDSELKQLEVDKKNVEKAYDLAKKTLPSSEIYFSEIVPSKIVPSPNAITFPEAVETYRKFAKQMDDELSSLEDKRTEIDEKIAKKKKDLAGSLIDANLNLKATISNLADLEGEIKLYLVYVVQNASWSAEYEILVDSKKKDKVTLVYRGSITQNTGEDWNNVCRLTLETTPSTLRLALPTLVPLIVPIHRQPQRKSTAMSSTSTSSKTMRVKSLLPRSQSKAGASHSKQPTAHQHLPGKPYETQSISIPSGGIPQNVTIVNRKELKAEMSCVCVPRKDTKVYWNARILNDSDYAFLNGQACVYIDNKFILKSDVPFVSPGGKFDCSLGNEPSIQVTYPPFYKEISSSGFFTKTIIYQFSQRITISKIDRQSTINGITSTPQTTTSDPKTINPEEINEKGSEGITIKIIDQAPVSQDDFTVEMVDPDLGMSGKGLCGGKIADTRGYRIASGSGPKALEAFKTEPRSFKSVRTLFKTVSIPSKTLKVIAQWHGTDDNVEVEALGKDGKLEWVCNNVRNEDRIDLVLRWKAMLPANVNIEMD